MGLISLPLLNRVGVYQYWDGSWDSNFLYRRYFFYVLFFNKFLSVIFDNIVFNIFIKMLSLKKYKKGVLSSNYSYKNVVNLNYLGRVNIYIYQGWLVIVCFVYTLGDDSLVNFKKNNNFCYFYKNMFFNKFNFVNFKVNWSNIYNNLNYKNKF